MSSSDVKSDAPMPAAEQVVSMAKFLAGRGIIGAVWLDEDLCALERFGDLVDDVVIGVPLANSVIAFFGFEDEIRELRQNAERSVSIPAVKMQNAGKGAARRLNLEVYWMTEKGCYLLVVTRAVARSDIEHAYLAEGRLRRMAEAEVASQAEIIARANAELANANFDLEEFARVISHDLRAPLRGVRYAALDVQTALSAGDTEGAGANIATVLDRARRMGSMLSGLLAYSRIGRKSEAAVELDTRALIDDIVETAGQDHTLTIEVAGDWPTFVTIAEPLDIVLRNLVDNAVKHHDRADGRIVVSGRDTPAALEVEVRDDGPGIDPAWHVAIFQPFKQVSDGDQSEGSGIGLALVKKTLERFGGSIGVASDPSAGRGTRFHVVWPKGISGVCASEGGAALERSERGAL